MSGKTSRKREKGSFVRTCAGCGAQKNKYELLRIVRMPDGEIILDETGKADGRGAYVCDNPECIGKAKKTGRLSKTLGAKLPEDIFGEHGK